MILTALSNIPVQKVEANNIEFQAGMIEMNNVIDFQTEREKRKPHITGKARCMQCKHEWVAIKFQNNNMWLECPNCNSMKGYLIYSCEPADGKLWTYNCGNTLFVITEKGTMCANCGQYQTF